MAEFLDLPSIEERLRQTIAFCQQARTRGEFLIAVNGLHELLDAALDAQLGAPLNGALPQLNLSEKAQAYFPADAYDAEALTEASATLAIV